MPIIPGDQLTDDQRAQVIQAFALQTYVAEFEDWLKDRAFHFTRTGRLIVERGVYLRTAATGKRKRMED